MPTERSAAHIATAGDILPLKQCQEVIATTQAQALHKPKNAISRLLTVLNLPSTLNSPWRKNIHVLRRTIVGGGECVFPAICRAMTLGMRTYANTNQACQK